MRARNGEFQVLSGRGNGEFQLDTTWTAALTTVGLSFVDDKGQDLGVRLLDIDGDARPDLVRASSKPVIHQVFLNNGRGWTLSPSYSAALAAVSESATAQLRYVDPALCQPPMAADGGVPPPPPPECNSLVDKTWQFALVREDGDAPGAQFADMDGDGRTDIFWSYETTPRLFDVPGPNGTNTTQRVPAVIRAVYLNTGSGFVRNERLSSALARVSTPLPPGTPTDPNNPALQRAGSFVVDTQTQGYGISDVNGDGISDIVRTNGAHPKQVFLGTGIDFAYDPAFSNSLNTLPIVSFAPDGDGNPVGQGLMPLDYNGDGLLDYMRADESMVAAWKNTGTSWQADATFTQHLASVGFKQVDQDGKPIGQSFGDLNGDGAVDMVFARGGQPTSVRFGTTIRPDMLEYARTLYGEETQVTYNSSSQYENLTATGLQGFPTLLPVVATLQRRDGVGHNYDYRYTYQGALYDQRKVRGFARCEELDPRGASNLSFFYQDDSRIGRLHKLELRASNGTLRKRVSAEYQLAPIATSVTQVRTTASQEQVFDDAGSVTTRTETTYDGYLRVTELRKLGALGLTSDDSRAVYTYAENFRVFVKVGDEVFTRRGELGTVAWRRARGSVGVHHLC